MLRKPGLRAASVFSVAMMLVGFVAWAGPDKPKQKEDLAVFMRQKLDASAKILEGLTTEDFQLVTQGSKQLQEMSASEKWRISNDALYRQYSREFQRLTGQLQQQAEAENLDGATLAWVGTTIGCVDCHKYARKNLIAR